MTLYDRIETATDNLSQVLRLPRSKVSFDVEMLVTDTQDTLCDILAAMQDYSTKPTKANRNKLMLKLFCGKPKRKKPEKNNGVKSYIMTEPVLKRITTRRGKRPDCRICGKLVEVGDRVLFNIGRPYRHKKCYDDSIIDVED